MNTLTPHQHRVLRHIALGSDRAIAEAVGSTHRAAVRLFQVLYDHFDVQPAGSHGRVRLLLAALRSGELALEELVAPAHVLGKRPDNNQEAML